ncbi:iduronate 2-sulfatase isoform X2 [Lycorma delicatula]|uniref:iduronate 2-sulfatase isoform X2 n=1 Tax=Lycorma delicatula TaxID=130591 RepID=UPI003F513F75
MVVISFCLTFLFLQQSIEVCFATNILLIMVDDLRPALGCYGDKNAHTPNTDAFAKDSVVFYRAYAQQALCAPSRNSLLTSRRPDTLHLYDFYSYWRDFAGNFTTLPQYFTENGYITKSIGKVFHPGISSNYSDDQPYSWSEHPYHPPTEQYKDASVCWNVTTTSFQRNLVCPVDPTRQPGGTLPDLQSLYEAKLFLENINNSNKSFFLAVGFHKPHVPLKYPKRYIDFHPLENVTLPKNRFLPYGMPTVAWNPWTDLREREDIANLNLKFPYERIPDSWAKLIIQSYYAAVSYVDDLIGQLVLTLQKEDLYEDTIIVLIGDHGWSLGEHSEWSKFSNFEVAVNVPFMINVPQYRNINRKNQMYSYSLVELVDLFPTLVQLAGLEPVPECPVISRDIKLCTEGVSLVPLIDSLYGFNFQKYHHRIHLWQIMNKPLYDLMKLRKSSPVKP